MKILSEREIIELLSNKIKQHGPEHDELNAAIELYEQALMASWPEGAMGDAFDYWNAARAAVRQSEEDMTPKCPDCKRDQDDCVCVNTQERIEELERERDELMADNAELVDVFNKARKFVFEWDNCGSSGEWPVIELADLREALAKMRKP